MIKVYRLDDIEWWAGENLADVIAEARDQRGSDTYEDAETEAYEVSAEQMQKLRFVDEDGTERSFAEELQRMVNSGQKFPCSFAATDF